MYNLVIHHFHTSPYGIQSGVIYRRVRPTEDTGLFTNDMNPQIGLKTKLLNSIREQKVVEEVVMIELQRIKNNYLIIINN